MIRILFIVFILVCLAGVSRPVFAQVKKWSDIQSGTAHTNVFVRGEGLADKSVGRAQQVAFGIAGLGAIALGALAFFGRFTWRWFFGLIGGLLLISGIQLGIKYVAGQPKAFSTTTNT